MPLLPDKITSYTDYVLNLDKLTVFVSEHKLHHLGSGGPVGCISTDKNFYKKEYNYTWKC